MPSLHFTYRTLAPVRAEARDSAEMVTQLLFGDIVDVLETDRQWRRIRILPDQYEGWVDEKMLLPVSQEWIDEVTYWAHIVNADLLCMSYIGAEGHPLRLTTGCRVPVFKDKGRNKLWPVEIGNWKVNVLEEKVHRYTKFTRKNVLALSAYYLGAPYLWGGKSVWGIDCSGLTQIVMSIMGISLPRDASEQEKGGQAITFGEHEVGDLAFFENDSGRVHHVGIVLPGGRIRHANGDVHDDFLRENGIENKYTGRQTHRLCSIKRFH